MDSGDFFFELPGNLIAQHPSGRRGGSRLMLLDRKTGKRFHRTVDELPEILGGGEFVSEAGPPLLVFNNSKVRKARLLGVSPETGARCEFLLLGRIEGEPRGRIWKALVQRAGRRKPGSVYVFDDSSGIEAARARLSVSTSPPGGEGGIRLLSFDREIDDEWLERNGHVPLPPYIKRTDAPEDADRYQTVYAEVSGSVAAPTAGLHFTRDLLERMGTAGIESVFVTLHVGLGTFLPVRDGDIENHVMHGETCTVGGEAAAKIEAAKACGRKIVAVGTTSVRTLESAWNGKALARGEFGTSIFIRPGFDFKVVDAVFTNFHTPKSTLLMLVSAFAGRELILESYAEAVREGYRFFSYGDAMLMV